MKSERITFLATPEFKSDLNRLAIQQNTSVGALIRARFERPANEEASPEALELMALVAELQRALPDARRALREGLAEADQVLQELQTA
jgi:hypothetical protein